jgi:rsbT co-antagonist protein RsbR
MQASDFDLSKEIIFEPEHGLATWGKHRLVIFEARAIGMLRQSILELLGWHKAQAFFLRFGYRHGFSNFMQMKREYHFIDEIELLKSGPVIHGWEGIVHAVPREIRYDRETGDFYFNGVWNNSYEAEQHLRFLDPELGQFEAAPVCWTLMGYASGWSTAFFEHPLLAVEPVCMGMGHDHCEWLIQPPYKFGNEAEPYREALRMLWNNPQDVLIQEASNHIDLPRR